MLVVLAGTGFLVGSRADSETPTAAPLPEIVEAPPPAASTGASEREPSPRTRPPPTGAAAASRRFAWPPVAGATGYHVELFKGPALVFRDETTKPEILIRSRWRFDGREHRLEPGAYRWYVWPLLDGQRTADAIVQARLVVPR
jgi:hypothetical protein